MASAKENLQQIQALLEQLVGCVELAKQTAGYCQVQWERGRLGR